MQLLIVHRDAELGEQLVGIVKEHTEHHCGFTTSDSGALDWARAATRCSLLITQLRGEGVDGLTLGGMLSEMFAGLQTMFLPDYSASEQCLDLPSTKVFPEPIKGDDLLRAISLAEKQRQIGQDLYHALDVLQMLCLARRSGAVQLVKGSETAIIFLKAGNIVHAEREAARGETALDEIVQWEAIEFAYDQYVRTPAVTIQAPWEKAITSAISHRQAPHAGARPGSAASAPEGPASKPSRWAIFGWPRKLG